MAYEWAGMGWPNGAVDVETICALPSTHLLMLATEGRYHLKTAQDRGKRVLWRAIPQHGKRPAELKWNARRIAAECMNLTDEAITRGGMLTDFVPLNELDLQDERGDDEPDYPPDGASDLDAQAFWMDRYDRIGSMLYDLVPELRPQLPENCTLYFPPFTPDHYAINYVDYWREAVEQYDVILMHAYDTEQKIYQVYADYRAAFPNARLKFGEWHGKGDLEEEKRIMQWMANTMRLDPLFEGSFFFIYRWDNAPEWWSDAYDVDHNADRYQLFWSPPLMGSNPEIVPIVPVGPVMPSWEDMCRAAADVEGIDRETFRHQMWWESDHFNEDVIYCRRDSSAGAKGIAQIVPYWHPGVDPCNPSEALAYAAKLMAGYLRAYNGDWVYALAAYNAGAGALAQGLQGVLDGWPYGETIGYVAEILNIPRHEAIDRLRGAIASALPTVIREYTGDVPDAITLQQNSWTCAVRSAYVMLAELAQKGIVEPVTYGDDGPRDVWAAMVPLYDDSSVGLHDHTGAGVVEMLRTKFDVTAVNEWPIPFASAQVNAGVTPMMLGLDGANHWVEVRGLYSDGSLILENPAPTYLRIGNELTEEEFNRYGPVAMVAITSLATEPQNEMEDEVTKVEAEALRNENKHLQEYIGYLKGDVADALQKERDTTAASQDALQAAINTLKS